MLTQETKEIWVLGSKNDRSSKCVDWEIPLPDFSDVDILIINLEKFTIASKRNTELENALFNQALPKIFEMLMTGKKQVIVIMPSEPADVHWLPIYPNCIHIEPIRIKRVLCDEIISKYVENVETTNYYFHAVNIPFKLEKNPELFKTKKPISSTLTQESYTTKLRRSCDIRNIEKQLVGGTFRIDITYQQMYLCSKINEEKFLSNPITFLPPTTKITVKKGIDILIRALASPNQKEYLVTNST